MDMVASMKKIGLRSTMVRHYGSHTVWRRILTSVIIRMPAHSLLHLDLICHDLTKALT